MRQLKLSFRVVLAASVGTVLSAAASLAHADTVAVEEPHPVDQVHWGLGLGVGTEQRPYRGTGNRISGLPLVSYESKRIHFFGNSIDFKLPSYNEFSFTLRAKYAFGDGYKASDSAALSGMEDRNGSMWGGATTTWDNPYAKLSMEWLTAGNSKGSTVKLGVEHSFRMNRLQLTPHLSSTWMNSKYVDYYYGVKSNEATAERAAYVGKSTNNLEFGVRADYALAPNQLILIDLTEVMRGSGIKDSPLVEKSSSLGLKVGYLYKF